MVGNDWCFSICVALMDDVCVVQGVPVGRAELLLLAVEGAAEVRGAKRRAAAHRILRARRRRRPRHHRLFLKFLISALHAFSLLILLHILCFLLLFFWHTIF